MLWTWSKGALEDLFCFLRRDVLETPWYAWKTAAALNSHDCQGWLDLAPIRHDMSLPVLGLQFSFKEPPPFSFSNCREMKRQQSGAQLQTILGTGRNVGTQIIVPRRAWRSSTWDSEARLSELTASLYHLHAGQDGENDLPSQLPCFLDF